MELKNIKIPEDIWWEINRLKVEWRMKRISDVIKRLIKEKK